MNTDLTDEELTSAQDFFRVLTEANKRAFVDLNWLYAASLMERMAVEIKRRRDGHLDNLNWTP